MSETPPPIQPNPAPPLPTSQSNDNMIAMLAWLLSLLFPVIPALVIYLIAQDDPADGERSHAKETARVALNWQLTNLLAIIVGIVLTIVVIGIVIIGLFSVLNLVFCILGTVKAIQGEKWNSPLTINFIK